MSIHILKNNNLTKVNETEVKLEKHLQEIIELNLDNLLNLTMISSQFALDNFRLDSLAFDYETNSFVIIEYKRGSSYSVIDQGYSYLSLLLNNKAEFILEYQKKTKETIEKNDVDWSQSRVVFVANSFTTYQLNAINFKDLPIELWEAKFYDNSTFSFTQIMTKNSRESVKTITNKNNSITKVIKEIKSYTVDDHLSKSSDELKILFEELREKIFLLGASITEEPKALYIAYKNSKNFVDIIFYKNELRLTINIKSASGILDPKKRTTDFTKPKKGHWGNGDYEFIIREKEDVNYALFLIEQSYKINK